MKKDLKQKIKDPLEKQVLFTHCEADKRRVE